MHKEWLLAAVLISILAVMSSPTLRIQIAGAGSPIYIRSDGSIDPSGSPISSFDNVTYTIIENFNASIIVERSSIIVDGNECTVQGSKDRSGFVLADVSNVTIKNTSIENFYTGIYVNSSSQITISGNRLTGNNRSIELFDSANYNRITGNNITGNGFAIYIWTHSNFNTISGNNVTSNDSPSACIWLEQGFGNIVSDNLLVNNRLDAIRLLQSTNNTVRANNIANNRGYGIWLSDQSSSNVITANELASNNKGITVSSFSNDNTIAGNNISNNSVYGAYVLQGLNNTFIHNNFIANLEHVNISQPDLPNSWNDDLEGNYWSDSAGIDADNDGIGDTPHVLDANNSDNRPLMGVYHNYDATFGQSVDVVSNSTITNFMYSPLDSTIKLNVSNATGDQTYGFCRMCIPYALINETIYVTVDGMNPTSLNTSLYDNETHRWIYFAYPYPALEIIIIPEFSYMTLLIMLMTTTCLIMMATRKRIDEARQNRRN